ncbi:Ig-like domain-containing protein [Conexibacter sp. CPCC 206217]|uniref:Ig-like domain-containing protein n=1 Tax=Conexibacter sp. CPCC 206217 TaxID=3064574 RepID=UPI002718CB9B|nr:Ig-like domain-containing protein [Conexibacter sp. CPCC 206217]MDO8211633.1 Ig-like domain-containing protein [Conexibacter sp. CPCC 206217]
MKVLTRWKRSAAVLAAIAPLAIAATNASAAPLRTADTTDYTTARFLQATLGLPANDTDPAIEPVTYDHFQWLLEQPGNFAFLIGDPAEDASFKDRAQDVEAAAKAAGVEEVYWFDPNLSGNARVGDITQPNLDIRDPAGITSLPEISQRIYGNAWLNFVGRFLGNGVTATVHDAGEESSTVTAVFDSTTINDAGATAGQSTEVGDTSGGALYDYTSGSAPADVEDSFFFIYNKDNRTGGGQPLKIRSWVNLTDKADSAAARADVTTAIGRAGAANIAERDQFAWWKSEVNERQAIQAPSAAQGVNVAPITDAADDDGWRVEQITYPELVHLLKSDASRDAVILFGGTWCPNTRPVLPAINRYAQQNNVHVFNFDTVLDGGNVGGSTTSSVNPFQVRNTAAYAPRGGTATPNANPTFLYGELFDRYLKNAVTEYDASRGGSQAVTYFPGADPDPSRLTSTSKLQVPFVIGYRASAGDAPNDGVVRQWIQNNGNGRYTEYMSQWWFTNPQPNQLGITQIPLGAPIWSTINSQLASFTWQTDPATVYPNTGTDADAAQYLVDTDTATVTYVAPSGSRPASVSVTRSGPTSISPAALSGALAALGGSAPANYAAARTAFIAASTADPQDAALLANLRTVVGAWGNSQTRKTSLTNAWGAVDGVSGVAGGQAAVRELDIFFGGLPGAVVSTQTVTANSVTVGTAPRIDVAISNPYGRVPTGNVSLVVKQGGATVASASTAIANGAVSYTLPVLGAGTYDYTLSYAGDDQIIAFTKTGLLTVSPAADVPVGPGPTPPGPTPPGPTPPAPQPPVTKPPVKAVKRVKARKLAGAVAKAPTRKKAGTYKVTITAPRGGAKATGKVTIKLKKGKATKTIRATLKKGAVTVKLPKLARGTWKVTISWAGDARYLAASATGPSIKVK